MQDDKKYLISLFCYRPGRSLLGLSRAEWRAAVLALLSITEAGGLDGAFAGKAVAAMACYFAALRLNSCRCYCKSVCLILTDEK